jgi:hypothetical protein
MRAVAADDPAGFDPSTGPVAVDFGVYAVLVHRETD